jgi:DNA helicase-2/ATP-dependent DNA helicase PcrA
MIDYEKELNKEQLEVVLGGDGPCLVLAGAGSGKTRTITYRVANLLENNIDPKNILLVTFTNKAANEMVGRVKQIVGNNINLPWSGTFHHISYRILKQYCPLLGYKNNFSVLDSADSLDVMKMCLKQEGIDKKDRRYPSAKVMQSVISYARNAQMSIEEVLDIKYPNWLEISEMISRVAQNYRVRKFDANVMDFDDLLVNTYLLLLKSNDVRKRYSEQFKYVLVDEYQDTNKIQASIVNALASYYKNILVVGDDAQSIYSFRAADIQNILNFEKHYPSTRIFKLETNYRSTPDILDVANVVIENNENQYKKELRSIKDNFTRPELHTFASNREEANFICDRILELYEEGVPLNKLAVLFRAAFHSQALEVELTKRGIAYEYRGGVRFFERAHIKDVLAYLRIFNNTDDVIAWSRVLNMQIGIGPVAVNTIIENIKKYGVDNVSENLPARAKVGWNDFLQVWEAIKKEINASPSALIQSVINSKYKDYLESEYPDYRDRVQDLEQLAVFAENQKDLNKFLADATLQEGYNARQAKKEKNLDEYDEEKIVLSTIHQAKGLEWEGVFIINVSAGQFPSDRSMQENNGIEEERRLFYVAVTRAQKYLYFSYPLSGGFGNYMQGPSMFLEEVDRDLIYESKIQGSTIFDDFSDSVDDIIYVSDDEPTKPMPRTSFLADIDKL